MSVKSVISIDVEDAKFQDFLKAFADYKERAEDAPKDWHKLAEAISGAGSKVKRFGAEQRDALNGADKGTAKLSRSLQGIRGHQERFAQSMKRGSSAMKGFGMEAAASALGLDALAGPIALVVGGVAAIALGAAKATLALDKLTANKAKSAKSLGLTIGQQQAFDNYGSQMFENPDAALAAINRAKINPADRAPLIASGITEKEIQTQSSAQIAFLLARKAKEWEKTAGPANFGAVWQARTGGAFGGMEQAQLLASTSAAQMAHYHAEYQKHEAAYAITNNVARRAVNVSQAGAELKGKVVTDFEKGAASKALTGAAMGAIHGFRYTVSEASGAINGLDTAATHAAHALGRIATNVEHWLGFKQSDKAKKTLGYQLNNPLDISAVPGDASVHLQTKHRGMVSVAKMHSVGAGFRAAAWTLAGPSYAKDATMKEYLRTFAPPGKANPHWKSYVNTIAKRSKIKPDQYLNLGDSGEMDRFFSALAFAENGLKYSPQQVQKSMDKSHWAPPAKDSTAYQLAVLQQIADNTAKPAIVHIHTHGSVASRGAPVQIHAAGRG
ncbi:hypothetical protein [Acidithiobacillus sp.]|uniref:hypothetical protein n=1 Tax=Acidithiobacillus sp. TaxID=1872118 RepID=UPI003D0675F8